MPISDVYVVQYLLQETCAYGNPLKWQNKESSSFSTNLHGVDVELFILQYRSGSRIYLTFSSCSDQIDLGQPANKGFFRERYDSEEDARLAHLLRDLVRAVSGQCAKRAMRSAAVTAALRETIYKRLIGVEEEGRGD